MPKKLSYEYVKEYIEKEGYALLTNEYKGDTTKLELICPNGHEWSITWKNFKKGSRCPFCTGKKSTHNVLFAFLPLEIRKPSAPAISSLSSPEILITSFVDNSLPLLTSANITFLPIVSGALVQ